MTSQAPYGNTDRVMPESRGRSFFLLPAWALWRREIVRFLRQKSRVVGALGTPIVFWVLLGSGLGGSFHHAGAEASGGYLEYTFAGTLVLIVLFTAVFSTISIVEDRKAGFLQGVLVAPVNRTAIVVGRVAGATTLAVLQAVLLLLLAPLAGVPLTLAAAVCVCGVLTLVAVGLSALGFVMAWRMESTQGFHAVMNLFLIPMWMLSGALFPADGASTWLQWVMWLNPLTYGVSATRQAVLLGSGQVAVSGPSMSLSLAISAVFAIVLVVLASRMTARRD